jgi:hypothetical protein
VAGNAGERGEMQTHLPLTCFVAALATVALAAFAYLTHPIK